MMSARRVGAAVVIDSEHAGMGILTERDILDSIGAGQDGEIIVRVLDSGPGVPDEALPKIFEPFYRLDDARNRLTGGAGLGLSIADRAIRLHNGQLRASNRKEGGLQVEIRLPEGRPPVQGFALPAHS